MGEIDEKAFVAECKKRFTLDEAMIKASEGCSLWQENLKDPAWHPYKIIESDGKAEVKLTFRQVKSFMSFVCIY